MMRADMICSILLDNDLKYSNENFKDLAVWSHNVMILFTLLCELYFEYLYLNLLVLLTFYSFML